MVAPRRGYCIEEVGMRSWRVWSWAGCLAVAVGLMAVVLEGSLDDYQRDRTFVRWSE